MVKELVNGARVLASTQMYCGLCLTPAIRLGPINLCYRHSLSRND